MDIVFLVGALAAILVGLLTALFWPRAEPRYNSLADEQRARRLATAKRHQDEMAEPWGQP